MTLVKTLEQWVQSRREYLYPTAHRFVKELVRNQAFGPSVAPPAAWAVFDFRESDVDGPQGRRVYQLLELFRRAGFKNLLRNRFRFLASARKRRFKRLAIYGRTAILEPHQSIPGPHWLITDARRVVPGDRCLKHLLVVSRSAFSPGESCVPVPFGFFPPVYEALGEQQCPALRALARRRRLFFAGSVESKRYARIRRRFSLLPRHVMLETLRSGLAADQIQQLVDGPGTPLERDEYESGLVVLDTKAARIEPRHWLEILAASDFFLACPGQYMPMCHNIIEAMAVGSIPVTEYGDYMHPALEDGVNCIRFRGQRELLEKVKTVLEMPQRDIDRLRRGVVDYFERHLRAENFIHSLRHRPDDALRLHVRAHEWPEG